MAIIRNERSSRLPQEPQAEETPEEEEIDYSWHPSDEEFTSPITSDQWAELLGDATFSETDAARAMRCLRDYGGPATFQQLSIRYRGTMGRYRRWLNEAAQAAGQRYGVPAPQKDQFGMDEWWPLLYRTRATGKPGAGVFEMELRPEVEEAYLELDEQERQAKRAENARQLQRIEQLERARQEERERRAAKISKPEEHSVSDTRVSTHKATNEPEVVQKAMVDETAETTSPDVQRVTVANVQTAVPDSVPIQVSTQAPVQAPRPAMAQNAVTVPIKRPVISSSPQAVENAHTMAFVPQSIDVHVTTNATQEKIDVELPAFEDYLDRIQREGRELPYWDDALDKAPAPDASAPIDYATRYAERIRTAFMLIHECIPTFSIARAARALGDESVEALQDILNGERIPSFEYLDKLRDRMFVNLTRLEVAGGYEDTVPTFLSLTEVTEITCTAGMLLAQAPSSMICVLDGSRKRRTALVFCYGPLSSALVGRESCGRGVTNELESYAREHDIAWTTHRVSADEWDKLVAGRMWPGSLMH